MTNEDKMNWTRKLRPVEILYVKANEYGFLSTCYHLNLSSKHPLKEEHVISSLFHLFR